MTNGRGAAMASFMTKKKKYKFQVDVYLEELLEVPFVSAVLFAKLRLLDGGSFQDTSTREEVKDHKVKWNAKFSFPCKMMANASTGVLERCVLRISVRKECKGGRSFNKLGFVDLNLAEYAGAGMIHKKALLEGYDTRHRQDNSMLKFSIALNMTSGDVLFKVPSPSLKHKSIEDSEARSEEFSSGSIAGSIASGSSGFGSLPKKRPNLLSSELVIGQTLAESNIPISLAADCGDSIPQIATEQEEVAVATIEHGHSRNSSNTSQLSKASGYSSIHSHSHSRQSSSGDSGGHMRDIQRTMRNFITASSPKVHRVNTYPIRVKIPSAVPSTHKEVFSTPTCSSPKAPVFLTPLKSPNADISQYFTPKDYVAQTSNISTSSTEDYRTPESTINVKADVFSQTFNELQKSASTSVVESMKASLVLSVEEVEIRRPRKTQDKQKIIPNDERLSLNNSRPQKSLNDGFLRSKSDFEIPRVSPTSHKESNFRILSFFTPRPKRKTIGTHSTPNESISNNFRIPASPIPVNNMKSLPETRATSMSSLRSGTSGLDGHHLGLQYIKRGLPHRKLLEGTPGGKLAPLAISPDETSVIVTSDCSHTPAIRRPSVTTNPSSSSLVLSETGSLDRAKAAYERRKKNQVQDIEPATTVPGRVEITRVNPDHLIEELLKNTNLEQPDDSAESSGLQLFIAKDGTAALGNHEVKSQMSTGVQIFKQVVMDDNR